MISVENSFYTRFPAFADGHARRFTQPVVSLLKRVACETRINDALAALAHTLGFDFVRGALDYLRFSYRMAPTDRENIPLDGPVLIVANHPLGALDSLALLDLVGSVRRDVRILANDVLLQLAPLSELLLPCPVFGDRGAHIGLRDTYRALERGEAVIVFPAGEVSRIRPSGVRDGNWSDGFVRFARKAGAPVLPVHIAAHNSPSFYGLSMLAKPLATLLLPREMFAAEDSRITLTIGECIPATALGADTPPVIAQAMRRHVYRLARRKPPLFATTPAIAHPQPVADVRRALAAAEPLGQTSDGKRILLLDPLPGCAALREIGRLREIAFRQVGEGTGTRRDLDRYDAHYRHIVLWDEAALEMVGAYRLGEAGRVLPTYGMDGLYCHSLFEFSADAQGFLGNAVELGRSFVQPRYWGTRSLDYLWQGIGAYLRRHSDVRWLFGPVSLSANLPDAARAWIVHFHRHYYGDASGLALARNPYRVPEPIASEAARAWQGRDLRTGTMALREVLARLDAQLPTLYRQYPDLCDADGVRFLDFGIDPGFGHCIDGLIRLDLHRLKPAKRARYLGGATITAPASGAESTRAVLAN